MAPTIHSAHQPEPEDEPLASGIGLDEDGLPDRYRITAAGFLHCIECGCMVMEGYRNEHDTLHPAPVEG